MGETEIIVFGGFYWTSLNAFDEIGREKLVQMTRGGKEKI